VENSVGLVPHLEGQHSLLLLGRVLHSEHGYIEPNHSDEQFTIIAIVRVEAITVKDGVTGAVDEARAAHFGNAMEPSLILGFPQLLSGVHSLLLP